MACTHKRIRCTNCKFFCLDCGAELKMPNEDEIFQGGKKYTLPPIKVAEPAKAEEPKTAKKGGRKSK